MIHGIRKKWTWIYNIVKTYIYKRRVKLSSKFNDKALFIYFFEESHISVKLWSSLTEENVFWSFIASFLVRNGFNNFLNPSVNSSIESISAIQHIPKSAIENIPVDNPVDSVIACEPRELCWSIGILMFDWNAFGLSKRLKLQ